MAKFAIFLLLGVALASAAPSLLESSQNDIKDHQENEQHASHRVSGSTREQIPYIQRENESERQFYQRLFELYNMPGHEEVVLVLGNAGRGKTTAAALLGGEELTAIDLGYNVFNITDEKQLISSSLTPRTSSRINIFTDVQSNTTFYDLPGFGETDIERHYTPIAYVRDKTFPLTKSVKILLVVSKSSVEFGEPRRYFLNMLDIVARFVNDVECYGDAIAMVVNKVSNSVDGEEHKFKLIQDGSIIDDESIIDDVANYLSVLKNYYEEKNKKEIDEEEKSLNQRKIELIKVLLKRGDNAYKRIGILRRPMEAGPISEMKLLMKEKANILHIVNENLQYVSID